MGGGLFAVGTIGGTKVQAYLPRQKSRPSVWGRDGVRVGFRAAYWNDPWIVGWAAGCG